MEGSQDGIRSWDAIATTAEALRTQEMSGDRESTKRSKRRKEERPSRLDVEQHALRAVLPELLNAASQSSFGLIPPGVANIVADYTEVLTWKLATQPPGLHGPIKRSSDTSARHAGPEWPYNAAYISGDTALSSGVHAWRVKVQGFEEEGGYYMVLGIAEAGKVLAEDSYEDPSFYGIMVGDVVDYWAAGEATAGDEKDSAGLDSIDSGERLDLVLDADNCTLSIITLKDGRKYTFANLPRGKAWVPHFNLDPGNGMSVGVIAPEQAGRVEF